MTAALKPRYIALLVALFLAALRPLHAVAQSSEELALELRLIGTAAGPGGLAILQDPNGRVHFLEVGDETGGFTLSRIERDRVTFMRGVLETTIYLSTGEPRDGRLAATRKEFVDKLAYIRESVGEETPLMLAGDRLTATSRGRYVNLPIPQELTGELDDILSGIPLLRVPRESIAPRGEPYPPDTEH